MRNGSSLQTAARRRPSRRRNGPNMVPAHGGSSPRQQLPCCSTLGGRHRPDAARGAPGAPALPPSSRPRHCPRGFGCGQLHQCLAMASRVVGVGESPTVLPFDSKHSPTTCTMEPTPHRRNRKLAPPSHMTASPALEAQTRRGVGTRSWPCHHAPQLPPPTSMVRRQPLRALDSSLMYRLPGAARAHTASGIVHSAETSTSRRGHSMGHAHSDQTGS